jgi:hypothetical protein
MPFDGADSPTFLALAKLAAARELISDQRRWCKGSLINAAGQMCILGALQRADAEDELKPLILVAAREVTGRTFRSIERFNDHDKTSHSTVLEVLDRTRDGLVTGRYSVGSRPAPFVRWRSLCRRFVADTLLKA